MIKTFFRLLFIVVLIVVAAYFIPKDVRISARNKVLTALARITPESVKQKIEPLIETPIERRTELIKQLNENINLIKNSLGNKTLTVASSSKTLASAPTSSGGLNVWSANSLSSSDIIKKLEESQKLLADLEKASGAQSVTNKITTSIFSAITGSSNQSNSSTSTATSTATSTCP